MAYFIVETEEQLQDLEPLEDSFVEVLLGNNLYHPKLNSMIGVYYRTKEKGYILPISHSETFSLPVQAIRDFLAKHIKLYCLDKKLVSYFLDTTNMVDLGFIIMNEENKMPEIDSDPLIHREFYRNFSHGPQLNRLIPIVKLYERSENIYQNISSYIGKDNHWNDFTNSMIKAYKKVEEIGIVIDPHKFEDNFQSVNTKFSVSRNKIYSSYNLYNLTSRPTNAFNGVNFLAINKDDGSRESFIPANNMFIELDFEAYHLRLIANMVQEYVGSTESIHKLLAKEYYQKEDISEEEYKEAKQLSFQQIYGGIKEEYAHIPFFDKILKMQESLWKRYNHHGGIHLSTGRWLRKSENLYKQKLFNYYIQNMETVSNVKLLEEIQLLFELEKYKSKILLVVYDSFLIDFHSEDGRECIDKIKEIINNQGLTAQFKYGANYGSLKKPNYLC